ncbi:hypothetical protein HDV03_004841 [Kappamyces sp. JEL0829]|nr:hypothetical protein HDV03_004841 [Kappamyces sp. JEL0829]
MLMRDPVDGTIKSFFLFTDLAIRAMGEFKLECTVVDMTRCLERQFCCLARLISEDGDDRSFIYQSESICRSDEAGTDGDSTASPLFQENLRGSKLSTGQFLFDPRDGASKLFFLFTDLAIRAIGVFRIECTIVDVQL